MSTDIPSDPQALAEGCADRLWSGDKTSRMLGIRRDSIAPGSATVSMIVGENMVNGLDMAHGGLMFTLADVAFALACNTRNAIAVGNYCSVHFLRPASRGDRLIATARESLLEGRNGIYDVTVSDQAGRTVIEFRGHSKVVSGTHFPETSDQSAEAEA
ncbi:hydroxyphenylacetyl-CoA thioesterase PaaI [Hoeflea sp.]|uniref:hydroxyphenylacetyl-CoA thioesterase PaaI n=1 Tax=Hoeflea sp. TaxID=1940281 RepID=UPI0025BF8BE0|nr:hydroxyphenylacetyl-CoA thioesterase PaaI [Hoeflea sp.]